jgi:nifR3 family TIM-barrel protein
MTKDEAISALRQPLQLGPLSLRNRLILAPLAGVSDVPFRRICAEHHAGLTFVEMMAANSVQAKNRRTLQMLTRHPDEPALGVQLSGPTIETVLRATAFLAQRNFDIIDLNMGCPVRKIVQKGWGCALLKDPGKILDMVAACRDVVDGPLSVKIRLGFSRDDVNVRETSAAIAKGGADLITIHGRTREDNYGVPVQFEDIAAGFKAARDMRPDIICVGNGNILQPEGAVEMIQKTGCDAVMISRGALGDPWLFEELAGEGSRHITPEVWLSTVLRHIDYHEEFHGDIPFAPMLFRKHLLWYVTGFRYARRHRDELANSDNFDHMRSTLKEFVATQREGELRFSESLPKNAADFDPKYDMHRKLDRPA